MAKDSTPATRKDIDDVLSVIRDFMKQVDKRFNAVERHLDEHDKRFDEHDKQFRELSGAIAELSLQVRDYHNEMLAQSRQMDRLREAILELAQKTGVKLSVDL